VDLRTWISDDIGSLRNRLDGGVLSVIPHDRRTERVDGGGIAPIYVLWHMARHQDVAVNRVLAHTDEVVEAWTDRLGVDTDLWRGLAEAEDGDLVEILDPEAVDGYMLAVLDRSAAWLADADLGDLDATAETDEALRGLGLPEDRFDWLYNMWRGKPRSFFLSWEAIGHGYNHLGELIAIRNRMGLSPF
jgi:hypothetical protein